MTIAIFDSGAGGLTVLKTFLNLGCFADFIYFADYQHLPYGEKQPKEVAQYVLESADFLAKKGIDALIVACNTATSLAIAELRNQERFQFPIFGMEPAVKLAVDQLKKTKKKEKCKILISSTEITAKSQQLTRLKQRFSDQAKFETVVLGDLVKFVENNNFDQQIINDYLAKKIDNQNNFDAVVLGCTHFSFFKKNFINYFGSDTLIVDGNLGTAQHVINQLQLNYGDKSLQNKNNQQLTFYFSKKRNIQLEKYYLDLLNKLP